MPPAMTVLTANLTCLSHMPGAGGSAGGGSSVTIRAAVGAGSPPRCMNFADDVRTIQSALNRFTPLNGGPEPSLVVDGICGPKTRAAIYHFQEKWDLKPKNWKVPDGIVDPDGPTIARLRQGAGSLPSLAAEFMSRIPQVVVVLMKASRCVSTARLFLERRNAPAAGLLTALSSIGEADAAKVERHFHVKQTGNALARVAEIETMFLNMLTAVGFVPQGLVLAANGPPSMAQGSFMFTFAGGYHLRGINDTFEGIPVGSIYLCPKARTLAPDGFTYAMIHELAHFTGPTVNGITDHAYFHKDQQRYRALTANLAFRNADSYSQFAFDAIDKPDFVLTG